MKLRRRDYSRWIPKPPPQPPRAPDLERYVEPQERTWVSMPGEEGHPENPEEGMMYADPEGVIHVYNGSRWLPQTSAPTLEVQAGSEPMFEALSTAPSNTLTFADTGQIAAGGDVILTAGPPDGEVRFVLSDGRELEVSELLEWMDYTSRQVRILQQQVGELRNGQNQASEEEGT